jgi:hypothetical protein
MAKTPRVPKSAKTQARRSFARKQKMRNRAETLVERMNNESLPIKQRLDAVTTLVEFLVRDSIQDEG